MLLCGRIRTALDLSLGTHLGITDIPIRALTNVTLCLPAPLRAYDGSVGDKNLSAKSRGQESKALSVLVLELGMSDVG